MDRRTVKTEGTFELQSEGNRNSSEPTAKLIHVILDVITSHVSGKFIKVG